MNKILAATLLLILLAACAPSPQAAPTQPPEVLPTQTPAPPPATPPSPSVPPDQPTPAPTSSPYLSPRPSPTPASQVYVDPEGRYQVELPVNWLPGDQAGTFAGPDGYFQAGDLPEMGFYSRAYQVCMRLEQAMPEPAASLMLPFSDKIDSCQVVPIPYQNPIWARAVIKAPGMPPEKRYFYFETDGAHSPEISASLKMAVPTSLDDFLAFPSGALRPADQAFWDTPRASAAGVTLSETRLTVPAGDSPAKNYQFPGFVPRDLWLRGLGPKPTATIDPLVEANLVLGRFGFELRQTSTEQNSPYDLYQNGKRIREHISLRQAPILSASGRDFALPFSSANGEEILHRTGPQQLSMALGAPERDFRFLGEDLLAPFWNWNSYASIDLLKDNQLLYRFGTFYGADSGLETFQVWQNHWLLEVRGFLIQDGVIRNDQLGYEEIFDWQLINGKPFYFFRKGPRVGISYDGQVQPGYYDDVAHYLCCGTANENPFNNGTMISFFAQRDDVWYFVQFGN